MKSAGCAPTLSFTLILQEGLADRIVIAGNYNIIPSILIFLIFFNSCHNSVDIYFYSF
jgi:hypothetical protein